MPGLDFEAESLDASKNSFHRCVSTDIRPKITCEKSQSADSSRRERKELDLEAEHVEGGGGEVGHGILDRKVVDERASRVHLAPCRQTHITYIYIFKHTLHAPDIHYIHNRTLHTRSSTNS